ncbi:hypothetical protein P171DRAFT_448723 [Karstenula rhodostoma CBS 690.94]|uniref:Uncharacterized protein n=1 Tax=Karstenula rhodostoma CBS 690.94 TaxID=1392251 RepID=A0A9P4P9Q5_9PLEO|nr:hypothetical protein P171DRAFT_448723 [Karstenula rhodostoma CBS 690.94]
MHSNGPTVSSFHPAPPITDYTAMLLQTRNLKATDRRDKIFAVHGLLSKLGAHLPKPDYSKSIEQIYQEAATAVIRDDKRLHILASITGEKLPKEIASWDDYVKLSADKPKFRTSKDGSRLKIGGFEVGKIQERSDVFPSRYDRYTIRKVKTLQGLLEMLKRYPHQQGLVDFFSGFIEKAWARIKASPELSVRVLLTYWIKVLESFKGYSGTHKRKRCYADKIEKWTIKCAEREGLRATGDLAREDIRNFPKFMRMLLDRKVMFITDKGHRGIASRALRKCDRIVYLHEVSLPMIVRKAKSKWRLVAPAYIQGGMLEPDTTHNMLLAPTELRPCWDRYVLV